MLIEAVYDGALPIVYVSLTLDGLTWFLCVINIKNTVQVKKNPHFLFFSMINCLFFWEKVGEIVENFSRFLQEIQYFLQEIPVFLPEILRFCL